MPLPFVIGDACAAGEAPPNTLAGVRICLAARAEAMELDLQLCADGVPVLMHDVTADASTNLRGPVRELSLAALRAADAGNGEHVPTLDEVLELVAGRLTVMCELKTTPDDPGQDERLVDEVASVIALHGAETWTAVHSFYPAMVERARRAARLVSAALISMPVEGEAADRLLARALRCNAQAVSVYHASVDRDFVLKAKRSQLTVWAWNADKPRHWERLVAAGADGIISNVPAALRAWMDGQPG